MLKVLLCFTLLIIISCSSNPTTNSSKEQNLKDIKFTYHQKRKQFQNCYSQHLIDKKIISVEEIITNITYNKDGVVTSANVSGSRNVEFSKCIQKTLRLMKFPANNSSTSIKVKQPLNFYPKKPFIIN